MQASMYDALLSGGAGATAAEQEMLRGVRGQVSNWRLRKRFDSPQGADAYRKATAFEALVSSWRALLGVVQRFPRLFLKHSGKQLLTQQQQQPETAHIVVVNTAMLHRALAIGLATSALFGPKLVRCAAVCCCDARLVTCISTTRIA